ncbi:MAG: tetratricopeptide repeat protein [Oscillospiraceae bacterium]|jgi:tetratricopeptide (TPR) repeat protein|nr:tetratricopeptide repeat protein [Oscillospiraceae bacterium]
MNWLAENWYNLLVLLLGSGGLLGLIQWIFKTKKKKETSKKAAFAWGLIVGIIIGIGGYGMIRTIPSDDPNLFYNRGMVFYNSQKYKDAAKQFKRAAKGFENTSYDRSFAMLYLGRVYRELAEYDKAIDCFYEDLAICRTNPDLEKSHQGMDYEELGWAYEEKELFEKAAQHFAKAYRIGIAELETEHWVTKLYLDNTRRAYESWGNEEPFDDWLADQLAP